MKSDSETTSTSIFLECVIFNIFKLLGRKEGVQTLVKCLGCDFRSPQHRHVWRWGYLPGGARYRRAGFSYKYYILIEPCWFKSFYFLRNVPHLITWGQKEIFEGKKLGFDKYGTGQAKTAKNH